MSAIGVWRSLVARLNGVQEAASSILVTPTRTKRPSGRFFLVTPWRNKTSVRAFFSCHSAKKQNVRQGVFFLSLREETKRPSGRFFLVTPWRNKTSVRAFFSCHSVEKQNVRQGGNENHCIRGIKHDALYETAKKAF